LQVLIPYVAPLSFDVPPPIEQRNALDRLAAKQIERRIKKKEGDGYSSDTSTSSVSSISSIERLTSKPRAELSDRQRRKLDKAERKRAKRDEKKAQKEKMRSKKQDRKDAKAHGRQEKRLQKDQKAVEKMEYIIVESLYA
jgi:hypothetical protein